MAVKREGYHDLFAQIPVELWQALNHDAERNERTATKQLIWILRERYPEAAQAAASPAKKTRKGG
jgi:hypothetical protein